MSYEVEIKFRVIDRRTIEQVLAAQGVSPEAPIAQEDIYLTHPCRDFAHSGEAFRLRREGDDLFFTYKGRRLEGPTKTREEIEIPVGGEGTAHKDDLLRLLDRLGFQPVLRPIVKQRNIFRLNRNGRPLVVALDQADGLGSFAEVETLADGPDDLPSAQAAVMALAHELGLSDVEPRSYLRMALDQQIRT
jgi:adenylate cyclase class 2